MVQYVRLTWQVRFRALDSRNFKDQPITQVSDAFRARVAGVNVVSDGVPGGSVKIRIRGTNSINKVMIPYVVDGMVRESGLEGINPEDIQSIQNSEGRFLHCYLWFTWRQRCCYHYNQEWCERAD